MPWKSGGRKLRWKQLTQVHLENGGQMEVGRCNSWELHSWSKAAGSTPSHSTFMQSHNKLFTCIHAHLCTSNLLAHCGTRQQCLLHTSIFTDCVRSNIQTGECLHFTNRTSRCSYLLSGTEQGINSWQLRSKPCTPGIMNTLQEKYLLTTVVTSIDITVQ